jgi:hypothetical protein
VLFAACHLLTFLLEFPGFSPDHIPDVEPVGPVGAKPEPFPMAEVLALFAPRVLLSACHSQA